MKDEVFKLLAQVFNPNDISNLPQNEIGDDEVAAFRTLALLIFGSVAMIIVALAGFKYITSSGNPEETAKAQKAIIYTLVGLAVSVSVTLLISAIINRATA